MKLHCWRLSAILAFFTLAASVVVAAPDRVNDLGVPQDHEMWRQTVELCRGVKLRAYALDEPRLMKAFVARINLCEPGIGFTATDRDEKWGEPMPDYTNRTMLIHTKRETTPGFMMQRRAMGEPVVLAVNATPWGPWDCAAAFNSKYASLGGWNVSHGVELSQSKRPRRVALFVVYKDGKADIVTSVAENRAKDVAFAFSGFGLIMTNGVPTAYARRVNRVPAPAQRTAFGLDASRKTLVLLVVDGRKPDYSIGALEMDLYEILRREGVTDAVNMDGGGSSTLTVFDAKCGKPWTFTRSNPRRNALNVGITLKGTLPPSVEKGETLTEKCSFTKDGYTLLYRRHSPKCVPGVKYPLVLFLHGAGERGNDNTMTLLHGVVPICEYAMRYGDAFVITPQCPKSKKWVDRDWSQQTMRRPEQPTAEMAAVMALLREFVATNPVDPARVYVTGISMGGFGTWDVASRMPGFFAAAMPVCGGVDETTAELYRGLPLMFFHGSADGAVPVGYSRCMDKALSNAGIAHVYTEYPNVKHNCWSRTYANDAVLDWLFSQKRIR